MDLFHIGLMDPEWTLPSRIDANPMVWMTSVNGLVLDARYVPRKIQEAAYRKSSFPIFPVQRSNPGRSMPEADPALKMQ